MWRFNKKNNICWISLFVAILFLVPTVWGAADREGKVVKKDKPTTAAESFVPADHRSSLPTASELRSRQPRRVTRDEMVRDLQRSKSLERPGSVYEAAAAIMEESPFFQMGVAGETSPLNFDTAGNSYYDINSNHRNCRQIAIVPGSRNVGINWAKSPTASFGSRNILGTLWLGASKAGGDVLPDIPMSASLTGRGGFCGMTYTPRSGKLILYSHHAEAPRGVFFAIEKTAGGFDWDDEFGTPDSIAGDADPAIWPTAAGGYIVDGNDHDNDGNTTESLEVIHFFGNEGNLAGNTIDHYIYSRAVDSAGTWIFPGFTGNIGVVVDTGVRISPTVVTSKKSRRVALVFTSEKQCAFNDPPLVCSDIYYIQSTNGGEDWFADNFNFLDGDEGRVNITNYDSSDTHRPTGDIMGVYDNNDSLVISWNEWVDFDILTGGVSGEADIYVWTKAFGPRKAIDGNFSEMPASVGIDLRRQTLNFPHIAVHDGTGTPARTNFLYMTFVQYGGNDTASFSDTTEGGFLNAEIYITCSTNNGKTWSAPLNATNSKTPNCPEPVAGAGTCASAIFASCAELADDTIHITYMSDEYPGSQAGGNHTAALGTNNEQIYMKYPAFTPVPTVQISVVPNSFFVDPESADTTTFYIQNIGNANLTVDSIEHNHSNTWLKLLSVDTSGITIIEGDPDDPISIVFDDDALSDGVYFDTILIYNNSPAKPLLKVPVTMIVDQSDPYYFTQFKEMNNGTVNLIVSNVINMANQVDTGGFYRIVAVPPSDSDTTNNLFDASIFMAVELNNGDTAAGRYVFDQNYMVPLDTVVVKDTTGPITLTGTGITLPSGSYKMARSKSAIITPDAFTGVPYPGRWYGWNITQTWYMKQFGTRRSYAYCYVNMTRSGPPSWWGGATPAYDSTAQDLYVGYAADWDVFVDTTHGQQETSADNYGRATPSTGLIWIGGVGKSATFAQDSSWVLNHHFGLMAYLAPSASADPYSMHVATNPRFIYPTNGYVERELYELAATAGTETLMVWSIPVTATTGMDTCVIEDSFNCVSAGQKIATDTFFCSDEFTIFIDTFMCPGAGVFADTDTVIVRSDTLPTDLNAVMTVAKLSPPYPATKQFCVVMGSVPKGDTVASFYSSIRSEAGLDAISGLSNATLGLSPPPTSCAAKPGDANASGTYTLGDIIATVNYIFNKPGCTPLPLCWLSGLLCRGDWNGSASVTLGDAIQGVNYIFSKPGGPWFPVSSGVCCIPYNQ